MLHKLSFKGIIIGAIINVAGTGVWGIVVGMYIATKYQTHTLSYAEQMSRAGDLLAQEPIVMVLNTIIGGGSTILGGYIAARIASHNELLNGTLSSFLCVLIALIAIGSSSMVGVLIGAIANPVLGFVGGYLRLRQKQQQVS